ncbi:D-alanyl-D-alanine carboxypeptidase [Pontibacter cellulosilyticus]|uniref:D-alanyl-D-alanine carboxypeptidase n=1 Tax=Pontibacter cellulosilyticus TaxID=1720253 RepID=A0A923N6G7_9BACT|nr:D-alanyl-D-alanine carboxypeptidase [Pontibacter cellulosilyticus]MBC5992326.1 D-alanyl-D-alanine carboxypeptidase [Pontibacter cellulosilyticus]
MQVRASLFFSLFFLIFVQVSCVTQKQPQPAAEVYGPATIKQQIEASEKRINRFVGFALYDPELGQMVVEHNADKYFVPASNTKLFTFYASLKMLGNTIPALKYTVKGDSLLFWGTGDPTFAHMDLKNSIAYDFLKNRKEKLYYIQAPLASTPFATNWGWDDYNYYYQPERSIFPIHGNIVKFYRKENSPYTVTPAVFKATLKADTAKVQPQGDAFVREWRSNNITYYPKSAKPDFSLEVPFITSAETTVKLLADTLKRDVVLLKRPIPKTATVLPGLPSDSVYKRMLQVSDNLLAEQLLVMASGKISDTLAVEKSIKYVVNNYLHDLPDKPVWVDGSGLSSMNMFTPRSIIALLQKLQQERPTDKLLPMLAVGGRPGTFRSIYKADVPFVFGKSGTLSHVHNQSGYIMTKSGKLLLFSFMNNNFKESSSVVREEMVRIMTEIHEKY